MKSAPILLAFILLSCSSSSKENPFEFQSFRFVGERNFEMCFSKAFEGSYKITFVTKSGQQRSKEGPLVVADKSTVGQCYQSGKSQHTFRSYSDQENTFYTDSLTRENVKEVRWELRDKSTDYDEPPTISGTYTIQH